MEPVEHLVGDVAVAHLDDDRHPHDVLDADALGLRPSSPARIAACSDCANAKLVAVAPEIMLMFGLNCACSTSCVRYGSACWLMNTERSVWFGKTGTPTFVIFRVTFLCLPTIVVVFFTTSVIWT